jgi:HAD superfamily hydrolase (TIGR01509 family)
MAGAGDTGPVTMFAAVLFDMDGTLVDTEPMWEAAEADVMAAHGSSWTRADQALAIGGPIERVTRYMAGKIAADTGVLRSPVLVHEELLAAFHSHLDAGRIGVHDGADALFRAARGRGLPVALVSNSPRELMTKVLAALPQFVFDLTLAGDEVDHAKPHPGPYLEAARLLGVRIEDCLVVEDSPTGVAAARASGAAVVAVQHLAALDPGPRGVVVADLAHVGLADLAEQLAG